MLGLYQKILQLGQIPAEDSPEQIELRLSGLVVENQGYLKVYNRIYATVFDLNWVEKALMNLRPYSEALSAWVASNFQDDSRLLRGKALKDANIWAADKSLSKQDYQFLNASQELEKQEIATALSLQEEESRILAQANDTLTTAQYKAKRQFRIGGGVLICSLIGATIAFASANYKLQEAQEGTKLERAGNAALKQFETKQIESLVTAMDAGQRLKKLVNDGRSIENYPATSPLLALQTITNNIREVKQFATHQDNITSVNWSHDGKFLITGSTDKTARIWNLSGKLITELKGHDGGVTTAKFSPDGKHILTRSYNKVVRIWDFSGKQVAILKHQENVNSASFSPDGKRVITTSANPPVMSLDGKGLVSNSNETSARIWDLSGNLLLQLPHQDVVNSASYSPDRKYILTASMDKTARIWDASGKLIRTLSGHPMSVESAYWSPNGKYILTNSNDFFVWDISGKKIAQLKLSDTHNWATNNAGFSADSQHILVSNPAKTYLWDLSGRLIREIQNGEVFNGNAEFSPDGQRFLTTNDNMKVWNSSGRLLNELTPKQGNASWSPDGKYIVSVGEDRIVRIWDLSDKIPGTTVNIKSKDYITQTSWSPNSKYVVTTTNKSVLLWDTNGKQLARFQGHSDTVNSANFSPDGKQLVTASNDKTARVWDTSGKQLLLLSGHKDKLVYAAFSPDGKYILTTTADGIPTPNNDNEIRIWSNSGKLINTLKARYYAWSPNGKYILTISDDYSLTLRNISGKKIAEFPAIEKNYPTVSFSPDGERIIITNGNTATIWNTSGKKLSQFKANQPIYSPRFSPDGKLIITTSPDYRVIIWDTNGKQLVEIPHQDVVRDAKFSSDGKRILTTSSDGTIRMWDISGKLIAQYNYSSPLILHAGFSPDGKHIFARVLSNQPSNGSDLMIFSVPELDGLLTKGCNKLKDYLNSNPQVREKLKVCRSN